MIEGRLRKSDERSTGNSPKERKTETRWWYNVATNALEVLEMRNWRVATREGDAWRHRLRQVIAQLGMQHDWNKKTKKNSFSQ